MSSERERQITVSYDTYTSENHEHQRVNHTRVGSWPGLPFTISSKTTLNLKEVLWKEDRFHCSPRGSLTVYSQCRSGRVTSHTQRLAHWSCLSSACFPPAVGLPSHLNKPIHDSPCPQIIHGPLEVPQGPGAPVASPACLQILCSDFPPFSLSVQSLSRVQRFATPWTAAHQASLSITNSQSLLKLMSIELVMPSNHPILCHSLLLLDCEFLEESICVMLTFEWLAPHTSGPGLCAPHIVAPRISEVPL